MSKVRTSRFNQTWERPGQYEAPAAAVCSAASARGTTFYATPEQAHRGRNHHPPATQWEVECLRMKCHRYSALRAHVGDALVGLCRSCGRWLTRYADAVLVFLVGVVSAIAIDRLKSTEEMWLLLPLVGSLLAFPLILFVPRWVQFANRAVTFLVTHCSAIVTAASFAAATSVITFSLVAGLASPERGPATVGIGQFLDLIRAPVGSALYTVGTIPGA